MNYALDYILEMPWLAHYRPQIDRLAISVRRRCKFDVSEVFTHLLDSPNDWPNVTVVDSEFTMQAVRRASDEPLCSACAVLLNTSNRYSSLFSEENAADEQWRPHKDDAVEHGSRASTMHWNRGFRTRIHLLIRVSYLHTWGLSRGSRMGELRLSMARHYERRVRTGHPI